MAFVLAARDANPPCRFFIARSSNYLKIPRSIKEDFFTPSPRHVTFSTLDKSVWYVSIVHYRGDLYFAQGVNEFCKFYGINAKDVLVFELAGDAHFSVYLFHKKGFQKKIQPPNSTPNWIPFHHPSTYVITSLELSNASSENTESESDSENIQANNFFANVVMTSSWTGLIDEEATAKTKKMSNEERLMIFGSMTPHCYVVVRESDLAPGFTINIPSNYARSELVDGPNTRQLRLYGKGMWEVTCCMWCGKAKITEGWAGFVGENDIEAGDALAIEKSIVDSNVWNVTIYRKDAQVVTIDRFDVLFRAKDADPTSVRFCMMYVAPENDFLRLPNDIRNVLTVSLPTWVTLCNPEKRRWDVKIVDESGMLMLTNGWVLFKNDYKLKVGELLCFKYDMKSTFIINVFDIDGMIRDYNGTNFTRMSTRDFNEERAAAAKKKICQTLSAKGKRKITPNYYDVAQIDKASKLCLPDLKVLEGTPKEMAGSSGTNCNKILQAFNVEMSTKNQSLNTQDGFDCNTFILCLEPYHLGEFDKMPLPLQFLRHVIPYGTFIVGLHIVGSVIWPVTVQHYPEGGIISSGWTKFVVDNKFKVGDALQFKPSTADNFFWYVSVVKNLIRKP